VSVVLSSNRIFLAGPLLGSDLEQQVNVRAAILAGDQLFEAGYVPHIPHLCVFWDLVCPQGRAAWMEYNRAWMAACGAVVRLAGGSVGADIEERWAQKMEIPVYQGVDVFLAERPRFVSDGFEFRVGTELVKTEPKITLPTYR
jgi:hypothetical protein